MTISPEEYVIDVKNIAKSFGDLQIVEDVTLQIKHGEIFGFLGPNGSGKTTTMRILCGLMRATSGEGTCLGYDLLKETEAIKRHVGYMPQYFSLYKNLTVYENLKLITELYGLLNRRALITNTLDEFNLGEYRNRLSGTLSGGWKQKLSLACALIHKPSLLLLDEPTASVDVESRRAFWETIHDLSERGVTSIFTSHNIEEIEHSTRISYLYKGRILMAGTIKDIIDSVDLYARLVKGKNLFLIAKQLRMLDSVEQVISFPDSLRVLGRDADAMEKELAPYLKNPNFQWLNVAPSIEDIFVFFSKKYGAG